jgi:hypothetical protein
MPASLEKLRAALPAAGLFAGKEFLFSPEPLRLDRAYADKLHKLGHRLQLFQRAANELYYRSRAGKAPKWAADYLDRGKPAELLEFARQKKFRPDLPRVIRPDLLLTNDSFAITELDSVPGGIGLTAWLAETYAAFGYDVLGGARGMLDGFKSILGPRTDILVSDEAETYRPEMQWAAAQVSQNGADWRVFRAEDYKPNTAPSLYRFFELFDLPNIPSVPQLMAATSADQVRVTPPFKPWLEEKLLLALFWSRPLKEFWRRELTERHFLSLQKMIPRSWVVDPTPLPHHAVIPGLEINDWRELGAFSQKQRDLVLKVSGFSPQAWGSRGVVVGSDVPHQDWTAAIDLALTDFAHHPRVLMRFAHTRIIEHPYYDRDTGAVRTMRGRVRLCPYYFVTEGRATLGGVLATIVPADKKIVHGMNDAILVPAIV